MPITPPFFNGAFSPHLGFSRHPGVGAVGIQPADRPSNNDYESL